MTLPATLTVDGIELRRRVSYHDREREKYVGSRGKLRLFVEATDPKCVDPAEWGWAAWADLRDQDVGGAISNDGWPGWVAEPGWSWRAVKTPEQAAEILTAAIVAWRAALAGPV